jgi:hypothetical protein
MAAETMLSDSIPNSDDDDFEVPAAGKGRKKRKARFIPAPSELQMQHHAQQVPARIAAMSEPDRYFFQDWLTSMQDHAFHLSDDALIKIFVLETRRRVPALSKDPAYPLDPKLFHKCIS